MKLIRLMVVLAFVIMVCASTGFSQDRRVTQQPSNNTVQQQQIVEKQKIVQDIIDEKKAEAVSQPPTEDLTKAKSFTSTVPVK